MILDSLMEDLNKKSLRSEATFYDNKINKEMEEISRMCLKEVTHIVKSSINQKSIPGPESVKIKFLSNQKILKLLEIIEGKNQIRENSKELRCIIFVERIITAKALHYLIWKMKLKTVVDVGFVHSANAGKNVKDPRLREDDSNEFGKMSETLEKFR